MAGECLTGRESPPYDADDALSRSRSNANGNYPMSADRDISTGGVLEQLTLSELVDVWVEGEIDKRLREVEHFHDAIIAGALDLGNFHIMPQRGGFHERPRSIEVLVEVRDRKARRSRIGAWEEEKSGSDDLDAFRRAYDKAMAHAIIQLLPAAVWRPWIRADATG